MRVRRWSKAFVVLIVLALPLFCAEAATDSVATRALLVGIDEFVTKPSAYPSATNNVQAMLSLFQNAGIPLEQVTVPDEPVISPEQLTGLIQQTFAQAKEGDTNYLYLSTHGTYRFGGEAMLILSNGTVESGITPAQLEQAVEGISGTKVIILDACSSGAFIGKGLSQPMESLSFLGEDFKVLTSSGALEESWYWNIGDHQGGFYFTQALCESLSAASGYPADQNHNGEITLCELYEYLLLNHPASTPQVYPQKDDFVLFRYDPKAPIPVSSKRAPIMDVTFSGTTLTKDERQITLEFIATRPVRVAYQIVYYRDGHWAFDEAQLIYDQAERYTAYGDRPGAISAGRKVRTINLGKLRESHNGYVLVQLVSIDGRKLTVHAGRVICIPPQSGEMTLSATIDPLLDTQSGRELSLFVEHAYPCTLSVAVLNDRDEVIHRICHRQSTRPMQIVPGGSVFYWDGTLRDGSFASPGFYRVRVQADMNDWTVTLLSSVFEIR